MSESYEQKLIYHTTSTLIAASAGTGKTYQLASRYIALLMLGVEPGTIVALTFTRKAAGEFRSRILHALAEGACNLREAKTGRNLLAARIWQVWSGLDQPDPHSWCEAANRHPLLPATIPVVKLAASRGMYPEDLYAAPEGEELRRYLKLPVQTPVEFARLLRTMVMAMSELELSTIDSFFNSLVCGNSLELGVNNVSSLDPADEPRARRSTINDYLAARAAEEQKRTEFLNMFAELTGGKGSRTIARLEQELQSYLSLYRENPHLGAWTNCDYFAAACEGNFVALSREAADEWNGRAHELRMALTHFREKDFAANVYNGLKNLAAQKTPLSKTVQKWIPDSPEVRDKLFSGLEMLLSAFDSGAAWAQELQNCAEQTEACAQQLDWTKTDLKKLSDLTGKLKKQNFKSTTSTRELAAMLEQNRKPGYESILRLAWRLKKDLPAKCLHDAMARTRSLFSLLRDYAAAYEQRLITTGEFAFDDIARKARELMLRECDIDEVDSRAFCREHLAIRTGKKYRHWMLDEFQDTSDEQFETLSPVLQLVISDSLVPFTTATPRPLPPSLIPFHEDSEHYVAEGSLFVVGDEKQGIYGFRTGESKSFALLTQDPTWSEPVRTAALTKSFRSSPVIMGKDGFVNDIFRKLNEIEAQDGSTSAVDLSSFTGHEAAKTFPGYVEMQVVAQEDDDSSEEPQTMKTCAYIAIADVLRRLTREESAPINGMSIGILTRTNSEAEALVNYLRDTMRKLPVLLVKDTLSATFCPLGEMLHHLFRWLLHPHEQTSCSVLKASFMSVLFEGADTDDHAWLNLRRELEQGGYTQLLRRVLSLFALDSLSEEQQAAHKQVITTWLNTAREFDTTGGSPADWVRRISTLSTQGVTSSRYVQVMTMHKSKGLEFDAVILPFMADDAIDCDTDLTYFRAPGGSSILFSPGNRDTRTQFWPGAFDGQTAVWKQRRSQEAYNLLYVAVTRARYANYILLNGGKLTDKNKPLARMRSESGLIRRAFNGKEEEYSTTELLTEPVGCETWYDHLAEKSVSLPPTVIPEPLGAAVGRRRSISPSTLAGAEDKKTREPEDKPATQYLDSSAADFGTRVHECWEQIIWMDENEPDWLAQPFLPEQNVVAAALRQPRVRALFTRLPGQEVYNEQAIVAVTDAQNEWVSGTIDRLVLSTDATGTVTAAHIIDYKTNRPEPKDGFSSFHEWLTDYYKEQMSVYKKLISKAFNLPGEAIAVSLVSCPRAGRACVLTYAADKLPIE